MKSRTRSTLRRLTMPERLEDRRCFNVDLSLSADLHTLMITGDEWNNNVAIQESSEGFQVRVEDGRWQPFSSVENILFDGRGGNDSLAFTWGMKHAINLRANLGNGDDSFRAEVNDSSDRTFPPGPCRMFVSGGAGNDNISALIGLMPNTLIGLMPGALIGLMPGQVDFNFDAGDGNDAVAFSWGMQVGANVSGHLGAGDDSFQSNIVNSQQGGGGGTGFPPGPCKLAVYGDGGADSINALIGLFNNESPAVDMPIYVNVAFDGGEGADTLNTTIRNVNLGGPVFVSLKGGGGDDMLIGLFDKVEQSSSFDLFLDGGIGDDILSLLAANSGDGVVPDTNLEVLGQSRIRLDGNAGNDRIIGQVVPCIKPSGALDIVFSGGDGNDIVSMMLTLDSDDQGSLTASLLGGDGNDLLALMARYQDFHFRSLRLLIDGGAGFDTYFASPLVTLSNVEKKL